MRDVDLHLLNVFDAIMTEGSVSRAAQQLALSQPAVSNAVARMRVLWNDPLFIRSGRGISPTPKALQLWSDIGPPLTAIRHATLPGPFDPATTRRRIRMAVNDFITYPLWPPLRQLLEAHAPGIDILAVPWLLHNTFQQLRDSVVDLSLATSEPLGAEIAQRWICDSQYLCAMRSDHPLAASPLTMEAFLKADHLVVSMSGDPTGVVDDILLQRGLRRRVAMTINNFYGMVDLLRTTNLVSVMSANFLRHHPNRDQIHLTALPFKPPTIGLSLAWHRRYENDPGHRWLREHVAVMCSSLFGTSDAHSAKRSVGD